MGSSRIPPSFSVQFVGPSPRTPPEISEAVANANLRMIPRLEKAASALSKCAQQVLCESDSPLLIHLEGRAVSIQNLKGEKIPHKQLSFIAERAAAILASCNIELGVLREFTVHVTPSLSATIGARHASFLAQEQAARTPEQKERFREQLKAALPQLKKMHAEYVKMGGDPAMQTPAVCEQMAFLDALPFRYRLEPFAQAMKKAVSRLALSKKEQKKADEALDILADYEQVLAYLQQMARRGGPKLEQLHHKLQSQFDALSKEFAALQGKVPEVLLQGFANLQQAKARLDRDVQEIEADDLLEEYEDNLATLEQLTKKPPADVETTIFKSILPRLNNLSAEFWAKHSTAPDPIPQEFTAREAYAQELVFRCLHRTEYQKDRSILKGFIKQRPKQESLLYRYMNLIWAYENGKTLLAYAQKALPKKLYERLLESWQIRFKEIRAEFKPVRQAAIGPVIWGQFRARFNALDQRR